MQTLPVVPNGMIFATVDGQAPPSRSGSKSAQFFLMRYRPEIDGLRAVAVVPVILFHAGFAAFGGGFVGVDIFFVISGYLITTIIVAEKEAGAFSLVKFYERRARRILPALFFVMAACVPFAWVLLLPEDMKDFSRSLSTVSVFSSNILFWRESGYFDTAAELKPLLHTWSLAVEEQFYVLFPLLLMATWRLGEKWILSILAAIAVLSLAAAQWGAFNYPAAAFFLLPTRAWELLVGALVAFHLKAGRTSLAGTALQQTAGLAGLAMIAFAVFAYDRNTPFPGFNALVPTIGTALLILFAHPHTVAGRILSNRALVGLGAISYSAYLWHQPLFAFARHRSLDEPSSSLLLILSVATLALAYLSWRFVETPFRQRDLFNRRKIFELAAVGSVLFVGIGIFGDVTHGTFLRDNASIRMTKEIEHRTRVNYGLDEACEESFTLSEKCRTDDSPEVLVWGDSYAMHLVQGFLASKPDIGIIQMTISGCGPLFDAAPAGQYGEVWSRHCIEANNKVRDWMKQNKSLRYVVLSSPFSQYLGEDEKVLLSDGSYVSDDAAIVKLFLQTLDQIRDLGFTPVVFSPTPHSGTDIGRCLLKASFVSEPLSRCDFNLSDANREDERTNRFLTEIEKHYRVVWLAEGICPDGTCRAAVDGTFIYRDTGHLSREGSAFLGKSMDFYGRLTETDRNARPQSGAPIPAKP